MVRKSNMFNVHAGVVKKLSNGIAFHLLICFVDNQSNGMKFIIRRVRCIRGIYKDGFKLLINNLYYLLFNYYSHINS